MLVLYYLARSDFDVEVVSLVGDLQYLAPCESVDSQSVSVDQQAAGTHSEQYLDSFRILTTSLSLITYTHTHTLTPYN